MEPFPNNADLRELFGVEPALLEPDAPWDQNVLSFESISGDDRVECIIEPVYGMFTLRWVHREREMVYFDLSRVTGLRLDRYRGRVSLLALFGEDTGLKPLRIQMHPAVHVSWGTQDAADPSAEQANPEQLRL